MIIHDVQQGSSAWLERRAGIPTASEFSNILTLGGKKSESRERYQLELLAEKVMGHPITERVSLWMARGTQLEQNAVTYYELMRGLETTPCGFITNDEETYGASPDRFVGSCGLFEAKAPSEWIHMGYLLQSGKAYEKYKVQVQGQLLVCEDRDWTDILSYHPELPEAVIRIERDLKFQTLLKEAVQEFSAELEQKWAWVCQQNWTTSASRKPISQQDQLLKTLKESLIELKK